MLGLRNSVVKCVKLCKIKISSFIILCLIKIVSKNCVRDVRSYHEVIVFELVYFLDFCAGDYYMGEPFFNY